MIEGLGPVSVYKRRGMRSMRLSVTGTRQIRVTIPTWASYDSALKFVQQHTGWLEQHMPTTPQVLHAGLIVGKSHTLHLVPSKVAAPQARVTENAVIVKYPVAFPQTHTAVQAAAMRGAKNALRRQAEDLLPDRLADLAEQFGFAYSGMQVKQLKSRWGSCNSAQFIILNLYLMQLPWHLIDYVLLHELVHTKHLSHGPEFWNEFLRHMPDARARRKQIRAYQPVLLA
jgi:predicted metal-dependent hydrolase